jgi:thioredoxin reductase
MEKVVIIGSGPAGWTAAIDADRYTIKLILCSLSRRDDIVFSEPTVHDTPTRIEPNRKIYLRCPKD